MLPNFFLGQENITILHWNKETFRGESLNSQQLVEVNQAGISLFPTNQSINLFIQNRTR